MSDHEVEQLIGRLLQIGVAISAAVILVGGALLLAQHARDIPVYTVYHPQPEAIRSVANVLRGTFAGDSHAITQLGIVLLILTPIMRVALTLVAFVIQRDRLYILVTGIVLALLVYGLIVGKG